MNCFDFGHQRSKVKVTDLTKHAFGLLNVISPVCVQGNFLYIWHKYSLGFKDKLIRIWWSKVKARPFDFEDGDVYMSSHEHRFRMFSSVEYEGQLYMTPQNFIESVTMSEPRSMYHTLTNHPLLLCRKHSS
uniref:Uncharacterized protein n=1 Tax=Seriola dumerili TaxID=41447 RepID=A0A3B4U887_SERDU